MVFAQLVLLFGLIGAGTFCMMTERWALGALALLCAFGMIAQ